MLFAKEDNSVEKSLKQQEHVFNAFETSAIFLDKYIAYLPLHPPHLLNTSYNLHNHSSNLEGNDKNKYL